MPRKRKTVAAQAAARGPLPELPAGVLDELIKGPMSPEQAQNLMLALNKAVIERIMGAEMSAHLGYRPAGAKPPEQSNERNGSSGKTVLTDRGAVRIDVPRDREGSFEPILIPKHERRFRGFDERIIAMYARGMSVREIQAFIAELGLWIEQTEGAKFWLKVFNELKTRGLADILIALVDGLKGLAEAIGVVYPKTTVQTCIVHLIRNSLDYASWKDRKQLAQALRPIYTAAQRRGARRAA